ncbi:hypothetical protein [Aquitalea magnusonii]|uniref:hypothetical protein n=1 Tax=Aquitalea magnusonii TaxID=332411 RepID=UPI0011AE21AC|nr:hypothetical protein [Aquitalea magnusonii]
MALRLHRPQPGPADISPIILREPKPGFGNTANRESRMPPLVRRFFNGHLMLRAIATICRMAASLVNQACLHLATICRMAASLVNQACLHLATICRMAASLVNQACLHLATFGRILAPQFVWHGGAVFQPPRYRPCNTAPAARDDCAVLADGIDAVCPVGDMNGGHGRQLLHKNRLPIRLITISAVSVLNTLNKETK